VAIACDLVGARQSRRDKVDTSVEETL
jgi:hypothetical protein